EQVWIANRGRSHHDPLRTALEQGCHRLGAADSAGDLELDVRVLQHSRDHRLVAGRTSCRVEVDDVNSLRPRGGESHCHLNRVVCIYRRLVVITLRMAYAATAKDVNRGNDDHAAHAVTSR